KFRDWSRFDVVESGSLQDEDIFCGWLTSGSVASEIGDSVTRRDRKAIEGFLLQGNLGACGVGIGDLSRVSPDDRVVMAEVDGGEALFEAMKRAKLDYGAYSAAGRNDLSLLLQFRLTQVIAKQRGGVWTDPASGDFLVVTKDCWERLPCLVAFEMQHP